MTLSQTTLAIKVIPNASRNAILGWENDELKMHIASVPEKGKANEAVIKFLAKFLGLRKQQIQIIRGETNRHKILQIEGIDKTKLIDYINKNMG
ncbi:DUF167 domain-containing protein [Parachlamydia acanthamoebae]|uniref:DUF167 domain-containing protein n=1 Tax=Parachlamydia acanthamoebae TaxID=83552 RepID=UPI0024E24DA6|nr:DUF167 domain-containing protein [Parachlamydia acanthamoebae]